MGLELLGSLANKGLNWNTGKLTAKLLNELITRFIDSRTTTTFGASVSPTKKGDRKMLTPAGQYRRVKQPYPLFLARKKVDFNSIVRPSSTSVSSRKFTPCNSVFSHQACAAVSVSYPAGLASSTQSPAIRARFKGYRPH